MHIHYVTKRPDYYAALKRMESEKRSPVDANTKEFENLGTELFYGPGTHVIIDRDTFEIISAARIR